MRKWPLILTLVVILALTWFGCKAGKVPTDVPPVTALTKYLAGDTCSTCHVEKGAEWMETGHFRALTDLQSSDHIGDHCYGCHVTGLDDNPGNSGYDDPDPEVAAMFGGVQCEKCHGPGGEHVKTFEPLSKPVGSWMCGECHDGSHHNTYTEWQESLHAVSLSKPRDASSYFGLGCLECHSGDYRMADSIPADATVWDFDFGITCVVCHDPHSEENEYQLRKPVAELCGECHTAGGSVPGQSPHHSTADVLLGDGGYEYPDGSYNNSYHTTMEDSCAGCHMYTAPYVDDVEIAISGHTWEPLIEACQECHSGLDTFDRDGKQTEIHSLLDQLEEKLDLATDEDKLTLSFERAEFNHHFVGAEGSYGIHNYKYVKALLTDSINDFWPGGEPPPPAAYVGSQECSTCHSTTYNSWLETGHKNKLTKTNGVAPVFPFHTIPTAPPGTTWADVSYVLGGASWKAYFLDANGYRMRGPEVSWYIDSQDWHSSGNVGDVSPYTCGSCHTVGWVSFDDNGGLHQDGLEGIMGTFVEAGMGCERCHGPGGDHIASPSASNIQKDDSVAFCGECHSRGEHLMAGGDNLLDTHSHADMLTHGAHGDALSCDSCHDVHATAFWDDESVYDGITKDCTDCHSAASHQVSGAMGTLDCKDCHMPLTNSEAHTIGAGTVHVKGDQHSHIFSIDTTGVALDGGYFTIDGDDEYVTEDAEGKVKNNLAYSCMQCHDGVDAFEITSYSMAAGRAAGIHD